MEQSSANTRGWTDSPTFQQLARRIDKEAPLPQVEIDTFHATNNGTVHASYVGDILGCGGARERARSLCSRFPRRESANRERKTVPRRFVRG